MKILQPNKKFHEQVVLYRPLDGLLAAGLFCTICGLYILLAVLQVTSIFVQENILLAGCVMNLVMILLTILFIKIRKGTLASVGMYHGNWRQSCIIGCILAAVLFFNNCLSRILGGASFIETKHMFTLAIYYLTVAVCEEIVFRGYIGTRLYGFMKNPYLVILVSGVLFSVMHFPYRMIAYGMTLSDLTIGNVGWLLNLFLTHVVLSFVYLKTNSLYGCILPHWMSNFAYNLIARS